MRINALVLRTYWLQAFPQLCFGQKGGTADAMIELIATVGDVGVSELSRYEA
jgi:hypothetical protein